VEGDPEHSSGFVTDLDARIAQSGGRLSNGGSSGPGAKEIVRDRERFNDLTTAALVHCAEEDVLEMDIGTDR
jgi:hypothetical protein